MLRGRQEFKGEQIEHELPVRSTVQEVVTVRVFFQVLKLYRRCSIEIICTQFVTEALRVDETKNNVFIANRTVGRA